MIQTTYHRANTIYPVTYKLGAGIRLGQRLKLIPGTVAPHLKEAVQAEPGDDWAFIALADQDDTEPFANLEQPAAFAPNPGKALLLKLSPATPAVQFGDGLAMDVLGEFKKADAPADAIARVTGHSTNPLGFSAGDLVEAVIWRTL